MARHPTPLRTISRLSLAISLLVLSAVAGPAQAGRWRSITPEGASIRALATAPGASGVVYAITSQGKVFKSVDGAAHWTTVGKLLDSPWTLTVDPRHSDVLYVTSFDGLLKSSDGGVTWSPILPGPSGTLRLAPSDPRVLYLAQGEQILRSQDGGTTWAVAGSQPRPAVDLAVAPDDPNLLYLLSQTSVFRSTDGGETWTEFRAGLQGRNGGFVLLDQLAVDPRSPSVLYVGTSFGSMFKSSDGGASWSLVWDGPSNLTLLEALKIDPATGAVYAAFSRAGVFRSQDGGATWSQIFSNSLTRTLALDSGPPGRIYVGTRANGIYVSVDGLSWKTANRGLRDLTFTAVAVDPNEPEVLFAVVNSEPSQPLAFGPQFLLRSRDGGATWSSPFGRIEASPFVNDLVADPTRPGTWYVAAAGSVLKTQDGGDSWKDASRGLRAPEFVYTVALAPSDPDRLYAIGWYLFPICSEGECPGVRIFRSVDAGAGWRPAEVPGLPNQYVLSSLTVDAADPSLVYSAGPGVFRSTDGGVHWSKIGKGLRGGVALVADPFSPRTLYAAVSVSKGKRVLKSVDAGATWSPAAEGLPKGAWIGQLAPDRANPGTIYAATERGVWVTRNGGAVWTPLNDGLDVPIWTVAPDPSGSGVVFAGGPDGLFELVP